MNASATRFFAAAALAVLLLAAPSASAQDALAYRPAVAPAAKASTTTAALRAEARTSDILEHWTRGDAAALLAALPRNADAQAVADVANLFAIAARDLGGLQSYTVLRTTEHGPSGYKTLARMEFERGTKTMQFVWVRNGLLFVNRHPDPQW